MNYIRKHIFNLLNQYQDLAMQHKEWTENLTTSYITPTEFIAEWFDDIFNHGADELIKAGEISIEEWEIIEPFHASFRAFADEYYKNENSIPADMTTYEPWVVIAKTAAETVEKLEDLGWKL